MSETRENEKEGSEAAEVGMGNAEGLAHLKHALAPIALRRSAATQSTAGPVLSLPPLTEDVLKVADLNLYGTLFVEVELYLYTTHSTVTIHTPLIAM